MTDIIGENEGNYTLTVNLNDTLGLSSSYELQFVIIMIVPEEEKQTGPGFSYEVKQKQNMKFDKEEMTVTEVVQSASELKGRTDILKAKITSISILGEMKIDFSTAMKTEDFDLSNLNSTYVDIYLIPA